MSVEREPELPTHNVTYQREQEQLPIITQREYAESTYVFLVTSYCTALVVQLLGFLPLVSPAMDRIPLIVLGLALFTAGVLMLAKHPVPRVLLVAVVFGAIVGL